MPSSGWSTCYSPTFHAGRGAWFGGEGNFLRWDDWRASTAHYFAVWIRPRHSGYVFNYNYETRPGSYDRDLCDICEDDGTCIETKRGEFSYYFDECTADGKWESGFYGWRVVSLDFKADDPYSRTVSIDGNLYATDNLQNHLYLVQHEAALANEFYLGSYRGVHNFFEGFIFGFEYSAAATITLSNTDCAWYLCGDSCPSMCDVN